MTNMRRCVEHTPKAELHVHAEGTLEPELKIEPARRNGIEVPCGSVEEMRAAYDFDELPSFLQAYREGMTVARNRFRPEHPLPTQPLRDSINRLEAPDMFGHRSTGVIVEFGGRWLPVIGPQ